MNFPKIMLAGSGEKAQYLVHSLNDNTIRFVLHYPDRIQAVCLCEAAKVLAGSVDILHASFYSGSLNAYWHVNRTYDTMDYFTYQETDGNPMELAVAAALLPVKPESAVQFHCTLIQGKESAAVTFTVSHLCVDGSDGKYLLGKLAEAYNLIVQTGSAKGLEIKNGSRAAEQIYKELSIGDMLSLMKNPMADVKMQFPFPTKEQGRPRMTIKELPPEIMEQARNCAKGSRATVNDLLLTAYYRAYASLEGVDASAPMSIMSMMDLRRHCKNGESDGLCNVTGSLPTVLPYGVQGDFTDTLCQIAEQTRAAKENPLSGMEGMPLIHGATHLPMGLLLRIAERVYAGMSLGLTNLGKFDMASLALDGLLPDTGVCGGPLKRKPSLQITAASFGASTVLAVVGEYTEEDAVLLEDMLNRILKDLKEYSCCALKN